MRLFFEFHGTEDDPDFFFRHPDYLFLRIYFEVAAHFLKKIEARLPEAFCEDNFTARFEEGLEQFEKGFIGPFGVNDFRCHYKVKCAVKSGSIPVEPADLDWGIGWGEICEGIGPREIEGVRVLFSHGDLVAERGRHNAYEAQSTAESVLYFLRKISSENIMLPFFFVVAVFLSQVPPDVHKFLAMGYEFSVSSRL